MYAMVTKVLIATGVVVEVAIAAYLLLGDKTLSLTIMIISTLIGVLTILAIANQLRFVRKRNG